MSSGQLPRTRAFFPQMKVRNPRRRRQMLVTLWTADWQPIWFARSSRGRMPELPFTISLEAHP